MTADSGVKGRSWSTGLFDCCGQPGGFGTCCFSTCCGPCQYGQNVERMAVGEVCCGSNCCGACCLFYMLGGFIPTVTAVIFCIPLPASCSCFAHMGARGWIRNKYGIQGSGCKDCLVTTFCIPCALCQEHRELVIHNVGKGGVEFGAPQQQVMVMVPQQAPAMGVPAPGYPAAPPKGGQVYPYDAPPNAGYPQQ